MSKIVFAVPPQGYPSYSDFYQLVRLAGYSLVDMRMANLDDPTKIYIFISPEGIPDCSQSKAKTIFWQMEYTGDYCHQLNRGTCSEMWASDPTYAKEQGCKFVLLGSDEKLGIDARQFPKDYDVTMLGYMTARRLAIHQRLRALRWPEFYPGHAGDRRHQILMSTRLMLNIHQHDRAPYLAPLRFALAAAYHMPMISEHVPDHSYYHDSVDDWTSWHGIPPVVYRWFEADKIIDGDFPEHDDRLHVLLCKKYPFKWCVEDALAQ